MEATKDRLSWYSIGKARTSSGLLSADNYDADVDIVAKGEIIY